MRLFIQVHTLYLNGELMQLYGFINVTLNVAAH